MICLAPSRKGDDFSVFLLPKIIAMNVINDQTLWLSYPLLTDDDNDNDDDDDDDDFMM